MKLVNLNMPAIWRPIRSKELSVRTYAGAYPYMNNGVAMHSSVAYPVVRYAKTFTKFKKDFSLFMFSDEKDPKNIEKFFDDIVKKLKQKDVTEGSMATTTADFKYLDVNYGDDK